MNATWLDLRYPLEPSLDALLRDLDELLKGLGIPYLLTGAMAREILLHYGYGCASGRETTDVDFGVTVSSWEAYKNLLDSLEASGRFQRDRRQTQRMIHRNAITGASTKVDLVPFGAIAAPDGTLAWPPEGDVVMRVLGYEQALQCATQLKLDETRSIPMASAVGLAILKLVAWLDRGKQTRGKDAVDFLELLLHHGDTLSEKELWDDYPEAMATYEHRQEPAAAWILGRQLREQIDETLQDLIQAIFTPEVRTLFLDHSLSERTFGDLSGRARNAELVLAAFEAGLKR